MNVYQLNIERWSLNIFWTSGYYFLEKYRAVLFSGTFRRQKSYFREEFFFDSPSKLSWVPRPQKSYAVHHKLGTAYTTVHLI